jgi:hypothetical protein
VKVPKATSTGTTIVGCLFKDGIVLGADTRATAGPIVADKNCEKVRQLATDDDLSDTPLRFMTWLTSSPMHRSIISANLSDAVVPERRRILSLSLPSFQATLSCMGCQLVASHALSLL